MTQKSKTVVFFGSGPVAAASLRLLAKHQQIEAVVTKPRAAHHKGDVPVLDAAKELNLPVHTAANKAELSELFKQAPFGSQLGVLIDFGIIVSQDVIDYFPLGIVNSHFSLLPKLRGADPITFAILENENPTGVSLMLLVEKMDEGPLLGQAHYSLNPDITTPVLTEELIRLSDKLLQELLQPYLEGKISPEPQPEDLPATYSRKLSKEDSELDFTKPAEVLEREIRAFIDWPKSRTKLAGREVVITKAHVQPGTGAASTIWLADKQLGIYCGQDILVIDELKPAGKGVMSGQAFLAGYKQFLG